MRIVRDIVHCSDKFLQLITEGPVGRAWKVPQLSPTNLLLRSRSWSKHLHSTAPGGRLAVLLWHNVSFRFPGLRRLTWPLLPSACEFCWPNSA